MTRKQMIEDKGYAMTGCTDCGWRGYSDTGEPECACAEKREAEEAAKRDPATDPQPGDVIEIMAGWTRTVISRDGEFVNFYGMLGKCYLGPFCDHLDEWTGLATGRRVIHVAGAE